MKLTRSTGDFEWFGDKDCDIFAAMMSSIFDIRDAEAFSVRPSDLSPLQIIVACRFRIEGHAALIEIPVPRAFAGDIPTNTITSLLRDLCNESGARLRKQLEDHGGDITKLREDEDRRLREAALFEEPHYIRTDAYLRADHGRLMSLIDAADYALLRKISVGTVVSSISCSCGARLDTRYDLSPLVDTIVDFRDFVARLQSISIKFDHHVKISRACIEGQLAL